MGRHPLDPDVMQASYQDDDTALGFDMSDAAITALSILTGGVTAPYFAVKRGLRDRERALATDVVRDYKGTEAYKALIAQGADMASRGAAADQKRTEELQRLMAVRSTPMQSSAPIAVNVPSFAIGLDSDVMRPAYQDDAIGLSWDKVDTGLTIANPAYGLYRLFGGRPASGDPDQGGASTDVVRDATQTASHKAMLAQAAELERRGTEADKTIAAALRQLAAIRSAPSQAAAPIAVEVPSFAIGGDLFEDEE